MKLAALSGDHDVLQVLISPDSTRAVYRADQDFDEVFELYGVPLDGSAAPVKLSGPMVAGGDVGRPSTLLDFAITADSSRVVYLADQEIDGFVELYAAPIDGSVLPVKLSASVRVSQFQVSPDGRWAVYRGAHVSTTDVHEVFASPVDGSRAAQRISGPMVPGGDAGDPGFVGHHFAISSDSRRVVYLAAQEIDEVRELFAGFLGKPLWRTR